MAKRKNKGWIKLHRQIVDSLIWQIPEPFDKRSAWIDLIMMASHEQRTVVLRSEKTIILEAGQLFTGMEYLANRWGWSRGKVIRYLAWLSGQGMIALHGTTNGTTVTIVNYCLLQNGGTTVDTGDSTTDGTTDGTTGRYTNKNVYIQEFRNKNVYNKKARGRAQGSFLEKDYE